MKLIFDGKEITLKELKEVAESLQVCTCDGGSFEELVVEEITDDTLYLTVCGYSTF
jgi:hypothetical protein